MRSEGGMVLAEDSKSGPDIGRGIRSGTFYGFITQWIFHVPAQCGR